VIDKGDRAWLRRVAVIAALVGLAWAFTMIIRIPIPASDGYFNIGDSVVMFAALLLGPKAGLLVGAIGPTLADVFGFPQFVLATAIIKGAEGLFVGLIAGNVKTAREPAVIIALTVGIVTIVAGYFIFEAFIYPWLATYIPFFGVTDFTAAVAEILPNVLQGVVSALIAFGAWKIAKKATSSVLRRESDLAPSR
jgi:uncharacterized membrane protein